MRTVSCYPGYQAIKKVPFTSYRRRHNIIIIGEIKLKFFFAMCLLRRLVRSVPLPSDLLAERVQRDAGFSVSYEVIRSFSTSSFCPSPLRGRAVQPRNAPSTFMISRRNDKSNVMALRRHRPTGPITPTDDPYMNNAKLSELCSEGMVKEAIELVKNAPRPGQSVPLWNNLIKELLHKHQVRLAFRCFNDVSA
jgi:hypothetical protein